MRIIFSKDRPAQLDLLLRSLERYAPHEETLIIWAASSRAFEDGYDAVPLRDVTVLYELGIRGFDSCLNDALVDADETVTFFCDDDVLYREIDATPAEVLRLDPGILTFSFRLAPVEPHFSTIWDWTTFDPHDHGYPGSVDGHTFRTEDLRRMLEGQTIENPLMLETILAKRVYALAQERPLMACYPEQKLVGIDVNTVATDKARPSGKLHPQSPKELNRRFLAGERISLEALDLEGVDGCLVERQFVWEPA